MNSNELLKLAAAKIVLNRLRATAPAMTKEAGILEWLGLKSDPFDRLMKQLEKFMEMKYKMDMYKYQMDAWRAQNPQYMQYSGVPVTGGNAATSTARQVRLDPKKYMYARRYTPLRQWSRAHVPNYVPNLSPQQLRAYLNDLNRSRTQMRPNRPNVPQGLNPTSR